MINLGHKSKKYSKAEISEKYKEIPAKIIKN